MIIIMIYKLVLKFHFYHWIDFNMNICIKLVEMPGRLDQDCTIPPTKCRASQ